MPLRKQLSVKHTSPGVGEGCVIECCSFVGPLFHWPRTEQPYIFSWKELESSSNWEAVNRGTLFGAGPGGIRMWTGTHWPCRPHHIGIVLLPSGGLWLQWKPVAPGEFLPKIGKMYIRTSLFGVLYEVQKDSQDISFRTDISLNGVHEKFFCNLTSKSSRSTLTSPNGIRVNIFVEFQDLLTYIIQL